MIGEVGTDALPDLTRALEATRRPIEPCPFPPADLRARLTTNAWLRRRLSTALMVRRAEARGRLLWVRKPRERARAVAAMEAVVGGTRRAHEVRSLAREHLIEDRVKSTLFWQPWAQPRLDEVSTARLRDAFAAGRGVIMSSCHMGFYLQCASAVTALGRTPYSVTGWALEPPPVGSWGRRIARRRTEASARGERLIRSAGSFALLQRLLEEREVVCLFFALPGHGETPFLGKPVMLASGSARLAVAADALVVPIRARRRAHVVSLDVETPLDPRDFADWQELQGGLAAVHERWILELPATMEDPNRDGAWERGASARGWIRPEPGAPYKVTRVSSAATAHADHRA